MFYQFYSNDKCKFEEAIAKLQVVKYIQYYNAMDI